jgi:hypothetical protein
VNPRAEAYERLGGRYEVRVLEPSPPAIDSDPWYADDPAARADVPSGREVVSPVATGDLRWEQLAAEDPQLADWCADRWLGSYRRLGQAPANLVATRLALHALAERVIAPARRNANTKFGLRYTRGGFGTPFFGDDVQIRVVGNELIVVESGHERRAPITSLDAAAEHIGRRLLPDDVELGADALGVDPEAAAFLGEWYGFAASVLEELRAGTGNAPDLARVQLWPEHFDLAIDLGNEAAGARGTFGASPGDGAHAEPYLYVTHWADTPDDPYWSDTAFPGASLAYATLRASADPLRAAVDFFRRGRDLLARGGSAGR